MYVRCFIIIIKIICTPLCPDKQNAGFGDSILHCRAMMLDVATD
jgi:hypothetical protein